ncbi:MAG: 50S ribosomal protein L30e [Candidatus Thermoplasmatota archaeon]|jgi:large subunit ribosomal protein L30e|nr:50S ribosomal protein L30e [Candidatus Thermoplasmatota archaeon]MDP7264200.1 50S ribosomal protein L30e [Candidatus Thermoplasmatota archaeon]
MDIRRALRQAVSTGTVFLGTKLTLKALKKKKVKLIIYCKNTSTPQEEIFLKFGDIPNYQFPGTNFELGAACGKPFAVSVLSIIKPGESDILALIK